jgi:ribosomal RNA-processing protein 8
LHLEKDGTIVADMGCGQAKIAQKLADRLVVHSFDLVAINERVIACDMAKVCSQ